MAPLKQFILLGDSITQEAHSQARGFALAAELQQAYVRRLDVINRGYSAYNTKNVLKVLSSVIPTPAQATVKFLTLWFGANDANDELTHNQYVPVDQFKRNLISIITDERVQAHSPNIIIFTLPPIQDSDLRKTMQQWGAVGEIRSQRNTKKYAEAAKEVGREVGVPVVDVWRLFMEKAGWKDGDVVESMPGSREAGPSEVLGRLLYDGLHVSPEGYRIVFDELVKVIRETWPDSTPYKMPYEVKLQWELDAGDEYWDVKNDD